MKKNSQVLISFVFFWLLFFFLCRITFIVYFLQRYAGSSFKEVAESCLYGLKLDLSMTGYLAILPLVVWSILILIPSATLQKNWFRIYNGTLVCLVSLLTISDINIYREWGSKINYRAMYYLFVTPKEALASSESSPILLSVISIFILITIGLYLSKKCIIAKKQPWLIHPIFKILFIACCFVLMGICIRGGIGLAPIQQSSVYFSNNLFINHTAVNTEWNLMDDIVNNMHDNKNPYSYFNTDSALQKVKALYISADSCTQIISSEKPNVVIIILESGTANVVESLGGEKGVMPFFEQLIDSGFLFTRIYATGDRTDKGLAAILSGFPSQATRSIVNVPYKAEKLPALPQLFKEQNYSTAFYYGGESDFFNFRSYLLSKGFEKIVDKRNFESKDMNSKWGAHDQVVLDRMLHDLSTQQQPFFCSLLTLSNHEPFEVPGTPHFVGDDLPDKFRSTSYYTDASLRNFFEQAKTTAWYANTLFIIVADHGHRLPLEIQGNNKPEKFHIPLLFFGEVIHQDYRGKTCNIIGSQTDIAATLLTQLGLEDTAFHYSKNLLNPLAKQFAFYDFDNGFGWVAPGQVVAFDNVGQKVSYRQDSINIAADSDYINTGKAYLQTVFQQYLNY